MCMSVAIARTSINNFYREITEKRGVWSSFISSSRHFVIFQQNFLIELRGIATLVQIKNLSDFFVSDKPEWGNHLHLFLRCYIDGIKNI